MGHTDEKNTLTKNDQFLHQPTHQTDETELQFKQ